MRCLVFTFVLLAGCSCAEEDFEYTCKCPGGIGTSHLVCANSDEQAKRSLTACIGSAECSKTGKSCGRNCDGHFTADELEPEPEPLVSEPEGMATSR